MPARFLGKRAQSIVASLACSTALLVAPPGARAQDNEPRFPQVKVDRVDASDIDDWRIHVSFLEEGGVPVALMDRELGVFLAEGRDPIRPSAMEALTRFDAGLAAPGFDGEIASVRKADVRQAVVFVVAAHADISPRVGETLAEVVGTIAAGLRDDADVGVIFYGDRVSVLWSPDVGRVELRDVNEYQHCLGRMRDHASTPSAEILEGEVPCGSLFDTPAAVSDNLNSVPAGQGLFPRLFGIPESPELMVEAGKRGHSSLDIRALKRKNERFAHGALETGLRILTANTPSSAVRQIVLISDGLDGYLRVADLVSKRASLSSSCAQRAMECGRREGRTGRDFEGGSRVCTREVLECAMPKVAAAMRSREGVVRDYLTTLVGMMRTTGLRVSVLALPGTDQVGLMRLRVLSLKTGGTLRTASSLGDLVSGAAVSMAEELATQVVIRPDEGLDPNTEYTLAVTIDREIASGSYRFRTGESSLFVSGPWKSAREFAIGKLGHAWGPIVLWAAAVICGLLLVLIVWKTGKGIAGLLKRLGKKKPKVGSSKLKQGVPKLKRPG